MQHLMVARHGPGWCDTPIHHPGNAMVVNRDDRSVNRIVMVSQVPTTQAGCTGTLTRIGLGNVLDRSRIDVF